MINTDLNDDTTLYSCMNHNNQPQFSKEAEEDMPVPPYKKERLREKNPVSVQPLTGTINMQ